MPEKNKFSKMNKKAKYTAYMYLALAVCVVAVMTVSIYSLSIVSGDLDDFSINLPEISDTTYPDISMPNKPSDTESSNTQNVGGDESDVDPVIAQYFMPTDGTIMKGYSTDTLVFSETLQDFRLHTGVDIEAEKGSAVRAYTDGKIKSIKDDDLMGKIIAIEHQYGLVSYYMNLSETLPDGIVVGAEVRGGDIIGSVGDTALMECGDPPHLHFELMVNNTPVNSEREIGLID